MLKAAAERRARRLQESNGRRAFVLEGGDVLPGLSGEKNLLPKLRPAQPDEKDAGSHSWKLLSRAF